MGYFKGWVAQYPRIREGALFAQRVYNGSPNTPKRGIRALRSILAGSLGLASDVRFWAWDFFGFGLRLSQNSSDRSRQTSASSLNNHVTHLLSTHRSILETMSCYLAQWGTNGPSGISCLHS